MVMQWWSGVCGVSGIAPRASLVALKVRLQPLHNYQINDWLCRHDKTACGGILSVDTF